MSESASDVLKITDLPSVSGRRVRELRLHRPQRRNALSPLLIEAMAAALGESVRDGVSVLVLSGAGTALCAGSDLDEITWGPGHPSAGDPTPDVDVMRLMAQVRDAPVPIVCRIHGATWGAGVDLAASCDFRVAAPSARFCLPPARLGISYAPEGIGRLASLVGVGRTRQMLLLGTVVDAARALDWGFVDAVSETDADLDAEVDRVVHTLCSMAPLSLAAMRRTLRSLEPRCPEGLRGMIEQERRAVFGSVDAGEGQRASRGRRTPVFIGR